MLRQMSALADVTAVLTDRLLKNYPPYCKKQCSDNDEGVGVRRLRESNTAARSSRRKSASSGHDHLGAYRDEHRGNGRSD